MQVSERTVRRDVQRLRDLGYDVRSRPGPGAEYRLEPGLKIPPLELDGDEITTIITSLLVLEAWDPADAAASTTRLKLERLLPESLRRRAAATALSMQVLHVEAAPVDWSLMGVIADAVADGGRIRFRYTDQHGTGSERTVQPFRHLLRDRWWYLVAFDLDRDDWRLFRLDRVADVETVPGTYRLREFPFDSIERWLSTDFGRQASVERPR